MNFSIVGMNQPFVATSGRQTPGKSHVCSRTPLNKRRTSQITSASGQQTTNTTIEPAVVYTPPIEAEELAASRKFFSLLPPFFSRQTKIEQFGPGLFGLVQPLKIPGQADIKLRMTISRLDDGTLLVVGPVAPTNEVLDMLKSLGSTVSHIIVPNTSPEHWYYTPALAEKFPDATVWTVPGFYTGGGVPFPGRGLYFGSTKERNPQATLGETPLPAQLQGQLDIVVFNVPLFVEAAVILPKHGALCVADTALKLAADDDDYKSMGSMSVKTAQTMGIYDRLGPITQIVFEKYPDQGRTWVDSVLTKDFDMVVPGHASAPVKPGKEAFRACFDFLYV